MDKTESEMDDAGSYRLNPHGLAGPDGESGPHPPSSEFTGSDDT